VSEPATDTVSRPREAAAEWEEEYERKAAEREAKEE
jgi:hypothetical protein